MLMKFFEWKAFKLFSFIHLVVFIIRIQRQYTNVFSYTFPSTFVDSIIYGNRFLTLESVSERYSLYIYIYTHSPYRRLPEFCLAHNKKKAGWVRETISPLAASCQGLDEEKEAKKFSAESSSTTSS